jgi:mannosyl-glycoprotein endo-beta-N-acetylglucosaminidase
MTLSTATLRQPGGAVVRLVLAIALVAVACSGFVALGDTARAASYTTTSRLNLREGPGASFSVIRVIPSGAAVEVTGEAQFGYLPVTYSGSSGFASADYLTTGGGNTDGGTASGPTGTRYIVDGRLNLRSGPGTSYGVTVVMPDGATVQLTGEVSNGYSKVTWNGTTGWAATQFLSTSGGTTPPPSSTPDPGSGSGVSVGDTVTGSAVTTARLNMRTGPGTSYGVKLTMPSGASVELMGSAQAGFSPVRYNGTKGWASSTYLGNGGSTPDPTPTPTPNPGSGSGVPVGDTVSGSAVTTARLNMRTGPGTSYGVKLTMPSGASVELMGAAQSGFSPVRYNGTKGWASSTYLGSGSTPPPTDPPPSGNVGEKVTRQAVNMRSQPTTSSSVVWVLPPGTMITITGSAQNGFLPAKWAHVSGWVHQDYLANVGEIPDPGAGNAEEARMIEIIYEAADKWGQPRADMLRVARCESHLDPDIVNPRSGTSGLFQFRPSTFAITPNGKRGENIFDPWSNADAAGWMWANGMRNHWACQ